MTYPETIDYLYGIRLFGQKLGLDTMRELLRQLGDPQQSLRFIHVAGTNGKGSVAAMIHAALTAAGLKAGLYTSPHLVSFCERFRVGDRLISEADVVRLVAQIRPARERVAADPGQREPTFFETVTALALLYFKEQQADVVVWETGLGGRLDATNVVAPLVSVITSIDFDHMQYLGGTLEEIAAEKCGIIKPQRPVVAAAATPALEIIEKTCADLRCPLTVVGRQIRAARVREDDLGQDVAITGARQDYGTVRIPLLGPHQVANCATAIAALEASGLSPSPDQVRRGFARTRWPGRFQIVRRDPTVVLDGAHNAAAAEHLAATLLAHFPNRKVTLILGVLRDKNYDRMCAILAPLADRILCVPVHSDRTSDPSELANGCRQANAAARVDACQNLVEAYRRAEQSAAPLIVIAGSLFLVGEALQRLGFPHEVATAGDREVTLQ